MSLDLSSLSTLIFDLDGVVWRGEAPVAGAAESLAKLRHSGRRCFFATNNSSRPPLFYAQKLQNMGIEAVPTDIVTSSTATALTLSRLFPNGFTAYVVGEHGLVEALESVGGQVVGEDGTDRVDCVVAGIDRGFSYSKLNRAQQFLLHGAQFFATNRDATFPLENGVAPGAGSVVGAVAIAAGQEPVSMGKPEPGMLLAILETYGIEAHHAAMVGDRLDTDIACAHRAGITALFVATGVTPMETARQAQGELRPDFTFDDLPALCAAIKL